MNVLILAGERAGGDPLARAENVANKIDIQILGKSMLNYVVDAVKSVRNVDTIFISTHDPQNFSDVSCIAPAESPCKSVLKALEQISYPVLLTTADHPLLTPTIIEQFLAQAHENDADVCVGLVSLSLIKQHYSNNRRTRLRFMGEAYSGANLFYIKNSNAKSLFHFWQQVEEQRKSPLRMIRILGITPLMRYICRLLSMNDVIALISERTGTNILPVYLDNPHAGIDVDKPSDLALVREIMRTQNKG